MSFTSPWLLWALFTASIPIIIHLVNRWRHRSVRWAAMEFLLRAARETRGTKKLLHYLILALRVLAVAALVTAFARPLLGSFFGWGSSGLNEVLLVLDRSASMDARPDKTNSLRDTIPPLVKSTFDQLGSCRLSLLDSTTETITQIPAPEALADLTVSKVTDGGADIPSLLQKAIPYLEESASGKTEIWIASDMQSSSWRPNSPVWSSVRQRLAALPIPPSVRIMALRDRPETNRGIRITQAQINNGRLVLDMEILRQGFDPNQPEEVPVNISVNNSVASSTLQLAGATTTIRKEIPLPQDKESGFGYVSLPHDDFSRDDISFFTFAPKPLANILINGPSGEAGKILSLMAAPPGLPGRKAAMPNTVHSGQFNLSSQALVIWHGPAPRADMEEKLKTFIEEGGLVLFLPDDTAHGTRRQFLGVSWGQWKQPRPTSISAWNPGTASAASSGTARIRLPSPPTASAPSAGNPWQANTAFWPPGMTALVPWARSGPGQVPPCF
ncbi:MAG: BatA domain-containing protein [Akkermansia sp.]